MSDKIFIPIPNFLSHIVSTRGHARNELQKEHLISSLRAMKITVFIPWLYSFTNLVTFKFGVHNFDVISKKS